MNTRNTHHTQTLSPLFTLCTPLTLIIALAALLNGCVVHSGPYERDDGYTTEEVSTYAEYDEYEEYEEVTTTTTTTTTTTSDDEPAQVSSTPQLPVRGPLFEEGFERPLVLAGDRAAVEVLPHWLIEWSEGALCEGSHIAPSVELQRDEADLDQGELEGEQHARLDAFCGGSIDPVSITTSLDQLEGATSLTFYARAATSPESRHAHMVVLWGDDVVMDEPLEEFWVEYYVDLTRYTPRRESLLSFMATSPGVIIDYITVD
jgi:hypothetical protein